MPLLGDCSITWDDVNEIIGTAIENSSNSMKLKSVEFGKNFLWWRGIVRGYEYESCDYDSEQGILVMAKVGRTKLVLDLDLDDGDSHEPVKVTVCDTKMRRAGLVWGVGNLLGIVPGKVEELIRDQIRNKFRDFVREMVRKSFPLTDFIVDLDFSRGEWFGSTSFWAENVRCDNDAIHFQAHCEVYPNAKVRFSDTWQYVDPPFKFEGESNRKRSSGPICVGTCFVSWYDLNKLINAQHRLQKMKGGFGQKLQSIKFDKLRSVASDSHLWVTAIVSNQELVFWVELSPGNNQRYGGSPVHVTVDKHRMRNAGLLLGALNLSGNYRSTVERIIRDAIMNVFQDFLRQVGQVPLRLDHFIVNADLGADEAWFWAEDIMCESEGIRFSAHSRLVPHVQIHANDT